METQRNDIAGSAVFWTLGEETDFGKFSDALRRAGFSKFLPERQTDYAALRDALTADQTGCEIFPVKGAATPTFEVVIDAVLSAPQNSLKSAKTQRAKAQQLRRKIEAYETSFTMALPDLKRQLDRAVGIEAVATLLDVASSGPLLTDPEPAPTSPAKPLPFAW